MVPELYKAFVKHYTLEDIQTYVERQAKPADVQTDRAEIKMFGPFTIELNREIQTDVKLRIDLTLTLDHNVYHWTEVIERYMEQSRKPVSIPVQSGVDDHICLTLKRSRVLYHGAREFLEFGTIEFEYQHVGDEI